MAIFSANAKDFVMNDQQRIDATIDILIAYKRGKTNLEDAVAEFCFLSGLNETSARKFLTGMSRDNVLLLPLEEKNHA